MGADPFDGVDGTLFQRRIDIARRRLLRHYAESRQDAAGKTADAEFQTLEVGDVLDLFSGTTRPIWQLALPAR